MNRAVFLDRDNTLIHADTDVAEPDHVRLITGVASAIASLKGLGYRIVVISNQPGVARGDLTEADVDAVNRRIAELIQYNSGAAIDRFYYCPYHPQAPVEQYRADHPWRKPAPGMLHQAADDLNINLAASWTVGDHRRDIAAGRAAGTRTILLQPHAPDGGYSLEKTIGGEEDDDATPHFVARSLVEAVRLIAQRPPAEKLNARSSASQPQPHGDHPASRPNAPEALDQDENHSDAESPSADPASQDHAAQHDPHPPRPSAPTAASDEAADQPADQPNVTLPVDENDTDQFQPLEATGHRSADAHPMVSPPPPTPRPEPRQAGDAPDTQPEDADRQSSGIPSPPFEDIGGSSRQPHLTATPDNAASPSPSAHAAEHATAEADQPPRQPVPSAPPSPAAARPAPEQSATPPTSPPPAPADPTLLDVLRQIQRDLKSRHADYGDFSYAKMAAALCQMLAVGCVLFGMINLGEFETFAKWMIGALFAQLLVITLLITHTQR